MNDEYIEHMSELVRVAFREVRDAEKRLYRACRDGETDGMIERLQDQLRAAKVAHYDTLQNIFVALEAERGKLLGQSAA